MAWILMIFFWVLVILGIVYLVKAMTGSAKKVEKEETAIANAAKSAANLQTAEAALQQATQNAQNLQQQRHRHG